MQTETIIYISIAVITALLLALFQYIYKSKLKTSLKYILASLRFISIFGILLLLINPKFESVTYFDEKPKLVVAIDNSASISYLKQNENAIKISNTLKTHSELNDRFNIQTYSFAKTVNNTDSINFTDRQSNIASALKQFGEIYANQTAPIVLITDGNQTYGSDYSYSTKAIKQAVYPVILGDSTLYSDLSIQQLNVNRYVYLKNKFPIEIIANYNGDNTINTQLKIWSGNTLVFRKVLKFSQSKTSEIISTTLLANAVGIKTYKVELVPLDNEKNKVNNVKNFGVEVIDQKTNIALVSDILHPDLGTIKKAIESNKQRNVSLLKPSIFLNKKYDYQLVILYQPNNNFNRILKRIKEQKLNSFIIAGTRTNWNVLNNYQDYFIKQIITNQTENYQPNLNPNYNTFIIEDLNFNNFPPLKTEFGKLKINVPHDILLSKTVNGINTKEALLATFEANATKHAILNGEGVWRWRAQGFLDSGSFVEFDNFLNKLIQYLSSNKKRKRINVDYKSFYNGNDNIIISAQYFNKNFEFDNDASLRITLKNKANTITREIPLLLNNANYTVDLSGVKAGEYNFVIAHNSETISFSGSFKVLEHNVEQQFLNADVDKLKLLAYNSNGKAFFKTETDKLIDDLLNNNKYITIQKSTKNSVPLIDWKYLLGLIAFSLFLEWFIRKYNGLI